MTEPAEMTAHIERLNDAIAAAEDLFRERFRVAGNVSGSIGYGKHDGRWQFSCKGTTQRLDPYGEWTPWRSASMQARLELASAIPELYDVLTKNQIDHAATVSEVAKTLREFVETKRTT